MSTNGNGFPNVGVPSELLQTGVSTSDRRQDRRARRNRNQQERDRRLADRMTKTGIIGAYEEGQQLVPRTDQTGTTGSRIEQSIDPSDEKSPVGKMFDFVEESISQPMAALGLATLPVHTMFGIEGETERVKRTHAVINEVLTGRKTWSQGWDELAVIQKERPFALQLGSELLFDPLNLVPGKVFTTPFVGGIKAARGLSKIKRAGNLTDEGAESVAASADEALLTERIAGISDPEQIQNVVSGKYSVDEFIGSAAPKASDDYFRAATRIPGFKQLVGMVAPAYLVDMSSNVTSKGGFNVKKFITSLMYYQEQTRASAKIDQSKLFRNWTFKNADGQTVKLFEQDERTGALLNIVRRVTRGGDPVNLPLSSERVKGFLPDLFTGRITPQQIATRSGIAVRRLTTVRNRARDQAVKELLSDPARRKQLLDQWSTELGRIIPNPSADGATLSKKEIATFLSDADVVNRIDRILANPRTQMLPEGGFGRIGDWAVGTISKSERGDLDRLTGFAPRLGDLDLGAEALRRDDIFFNEVVQNPSMFELTASQRQFIDGINQHYVDLKNYMVSKGVKPDSEIFGDDVPGNYFSNIWQMGMGLGLRRGVQEGAILGQQKGFENARLYDYAADAMDAGYRPIDIEETVRISTQGIYQMVAEKHLMEMAGGWTTQMAKRIKEGGRVYEEDLLKLKNMSQKEKDLIQKTLKETSGRFIKGINDASSALRTLQSGFDMGTPFIHGLPLLLTRPKLWVQSYKHAVNAMIDPQAMRRFQADHYDTLREMNERNALAIGDKEYLEGLGKEGWIQSGMTKAAEFQPSSKLVKPAAFAGRQLGRGGRFLSTRAERHFEGWLIGSKVALWESLRDSAIRKARQKASKVNANVTSPEYLAAYALEEKRALDQLASHVSKMTGTVSMANMGIRMGQRRLVSGLLMYAPRYRMACYGLMLDITRGNYQASLATQRLGKMLLTGSLYYQYIARNLDQPVYLDPINDGGKFMSVEVNGVKLSLGGAHLATLRFLGSLLAEDSNDDNPMSPLKIWEGDNEVNRMVRSQISPVGGIGWDLTTGRNYFGDPIREEGSPDPTQLFTAFGDSVLPFFIAGMAEHPMPGWDLGQKDALTGDMANVVDPTWGEWLGGIVTGGTAEFGGMRGYPTSRYERGLEQANRALQDIVQNPDDPRHAEYINLFRIDDETLSMLEEQDRDLSDLNWKDLNGAQKTQIKLNDPSIPALLNADNALWASRGSEMDQQVQELRDARLSIKENYEAEVSELVAKLGRPRDIDDPAAGTWRPEDIRNELRILGQRQAGRYADLINPELNPRTAAAQQALDEEKMNPNVPQEDQAYLDYITNVMAADYTYDGFGYDHDKRKANVENWNNEWTGSPDGIDKKTGKPHELFQYVQHRMNHDQNEIVREISQGNHMLTPYWEVPTTIMVKMNMETSIPTYKMYQKMTEGQKMQELARNPWIKSIDSAVARTRRAIREANPSVDAFLYRWGYTSTLRHELNIAKAKETPEYGADFFRADGYTTIIW